MDVFVQLSLENLTPSLSLFTKAFSSQFLGPIYSIYPYDLCRHIPVSVWKQCSLNVSVSSISMPELPCSGDSWEPMAKSLYTREVKLGMYQTM